MSSQLRGYKGRGVVLHTLKYGDNSIIVQLLTDTVGRQSYIVQGVRSARGRGSKAALFQPFFVVDFEGLNSSKADLHRFREVSNGLILRRTPFDIRRSTVALFCAEVIYRLVREGERNERLFGAVLEAVEALDTIDDGVENFHLWFLVQLSSELGFTPSGEWREGDWLDVPMGEFVDLKPLHNNYLTQSETALIARLLTMESTALGSIKLNRVERTNCLESLLRYYSFHLDTIYNVQSLAILKEIF